MEEKEWIELLKTRKASLFIKPTMNRHESGFRTFQVGYCTLGDDNKVKDKLVLRDFSDHIHTDYMALVENQRGVPINMDLTLDGYIRIWGSSKSVVVWEQYPMSSAELTLLENRKDLAPTTLKD